MRPNTVKRLIARGEGPKLDFKREIHLSSKGGQAEFAKDLMSLANTFDAMGKHGHLLIGVDDDGSIVGLQSPVSHQSLQQAADRYCQPPVAFSYNEVLVDGRLVGVVTVPRSYRKPHKFKREYRDEKRAIPEQTVFTRHLSHIVVASPEEVVALDREAEMLRRRRRRWVALGVLISLLILTLLMCGGGTFALRSPAVQAAITRFLPEGIPLLASGIDPKAAPLRQQDVETALKRLATLPSFHAHYTYVAALNGREDRAEEVDLVACNADYHIYRTANFRILTWGGDRVEEYRVGDKVYMYQGGVQPEKWRVEEAEQWGEIPSVMSVAWNNDVRLLGDAAWGDTIDEDTRFYLLYRKGRVEGRLCDIYQARYHVKPGMVSLLSSLFPVNTDDSGGQAEEEAWISQETNTLLRYTGRLKFVDEDGVEWEVVVTFRTNDIDQSCPIALEIPENAQIEER